MKWTMLTTTVATPPVALNVTVFGSALRVRALALGSDRLIAVVVSLTVLHCLQSINSSSLNSGTAKSSTDAAPQRRPTVLAGASQLVSLLAGPNTNTASIVQHDTSALATVHIASSHTALYSGNTVTVLMHGTEKTSDCRSTAN